MPGTPANASKKRSLDSGAGKGGVGGLRTPHGGDGGLRTPHGGLDGFNSYETPHAGGRTTPHDVFGGLRTPRGQNRDLDEVSNLSAPREEGITDALQAQAKALMQTMQVMQTIVARTRS